MKKITLMLLAAALLATSMSGCGQKQEQQTAEVPVLKMYMFGSEQADLPLVMEKVNEILEPKIGAKLDMVLIDSGAFTEKMNMKLATAEEFDICFTSNWMNPYGKGVRNGSYMPLKKLIEDNCPELFDTMEQYWWDSVESNGDYYAVPNQQICATKAALTLDRKWIDKYDLDVDSIKTIKDIEPFLQKIKDNEKDVYPYRATGGPGMWMIDNREPITTGVCLDSTVKDKLKAVYEWDVKGYEQGVFDLRDWFLKGYIRNDIASVLDDTSDFYAGKYVVTETAYKPGFEASQNNILGGDNVAIIMGDGMVSQGACTATMLAISATSKHPDKAIQVINLLNTDKELYNLISSGIEGKHYKWVDDDHIKLIENGGYYFNSAWEFGNQFNAYPMEGQDVDVWEKTKEQNDSAERSRLMGFSFNSKNVQTELTQMATVASEYKNIFNGSTDLSTGIYDEYKSKMISAGADNVLKEVQRQLDEYAKTHKE